jgi:hypothetical protein
MKLPADSTPTSDHIPCVVSVGISISKLKIYRFEYHSIIIKGFIDVVKLKKWSSSIPMINKFIANFNKVILLLDDIDEKRM